MRYSKKSILTMKRKQMGITFIIVGLVAIATGVYFVVSDKKNEETVALVSVVQPSSEQITEEEMKSETTPVEKSDEKSENEKKGLEFEKWVITKFPQQYYKLLDWKGDKMLDGRYPDSSRYPDLEFELQLSEGKLTEKFSVECKWRSSFYHGAVNWASQEKIAIYNQFAADRQQEVFLVLGVGGEPSEPERVYVIPLKSAQASWLKEADIEQYKRKDPAKDFFYHAKSNTLK